MKIVVPVTLLIIFLLLYLNFPAHDRDADRDGVAAFRARRRRVARCGSLGFNLSVAVAVGFIALAGVAAETGVVMLIYLDQAMREITQEREAEGAALRERTCMRRSCSAPSSACVRR